MSVLQMFLEQVETGDFKTANETLESSIEFIDRNFSNAEGQTIAHLAILSLIAGLKKIWSSYAKGSYYVAALKAPEEQQELFLKTFYMLFDKLLTFNFPYNNKDHQGNTPVYLLNGINIRFCNPSLSDIQAELIARLENSQLKLFTGRKYVPNLNLYRSSKKSSKICNMPNKSEELNNVDGLDMTLHQRFEILEQYFAKNFAPNSKNLVFANLGFIISDDIDSKRIFITKPIYDKRHLVVIGSTKHPEIRSKTHSEAGLYAHLCNENFLEEQLKWLKTFNQNLNKKIYAIVLDIYSTREVCLDCESILHLLQTENQPSSFLFILQEILETKYNYRLPKKKSSFPHIPLIIRTAGFQDPSWNGEQNPAYPASVACKQYNRNMKSHDVGVRFHLIPKYAFDPKLPQYVCYSKYQENHRMRPIYQNRDIFFFKPTDKITLSLQTGFSNAGGYPIIRPTTSSPTVTLSYYDLQDYTLHQVYFKPDKEVAKLLLEIFNMSQEPASSTLHYLYGVADSNKTSTIEQEINHFIHMLVKEQRDFSQTRPSSSEDTQSSDYDDSNNLYPNKKLKSSLP